MKVTCKTNNLIYDKQPHYFISLTIGKSYQVLDISENPKFRVYGSDLKTLFYQIEDNSGLTGYYPSQLFKSPSEARDEKINELLK